MRMHVLRCFSFALCIGGLLPALGAGNPAAASADSLRGRIRAVPNPWCAADSSSKFFFTFRGNHFDDVGSGYSRIIFVYASDAGTRVLPGTGEIRIYTIDGDLVRTIPHPRKEGGTTRWDLLTDSGQYAQSGIYIFAYESTAGSDIGKIIVIR